MTYEHLLQSREGTLGIITLNLPERRNPLSLDLMLELIRALDEFGSDTSVRAVILAAAGKAYSAGHDLSEMVGRTLNDYRRLFDVGTDLMTKIQSIPQPVIPRCRASRRRPAASSSLPATWPLPASTPRSRRRA